jgi:hypothetical protein
MIGYRLIEALGGAEVEVMHGFARDDGRLDIHVPGFDGAFTVPKHALIMVESPLPPEPPLWSVVLDRQGHAWQHIADGRGEWDCAVHDLGADWEELNRDRGPLIPLVPDPFAVPVELPWTGESSYGTKVEVLGGVDVDLRIQSKSGGFPATASFKPDRARELARALWAAADQAEATP